MLKEGKRGKTSENVKKKHGKQGKAAENVKKHGKHGITSENVKKTRETRKSAGKTKNIGKREKTREARKDIGKCEKNMGNIEKHRKTFFKVIASFGTEGFLSSASPGQYPPESQEQYTLRGPGAKRGSVTPCAPRRRFALFF